MLEWRSGCRSPNATEERSLLKIAVGSCLMGDPCRFDGRACPNEAVRSLRDVDGIELVELCPEVLGGLPVPRPPSEIAASERVLRVTNAEGADVTAAFMEGAQRALEIVQRNECKLAVLKAKSPSCGNGRVYDGTFTGTLAEGYGATARLLRGEGVRVIDEERLGAALAASEARHPGARPALLAATSAECPMLETERLVLRAIAPDDAEDVFAYCSDPDVGADAGWPMHRTVEDSRAFIDAAACEPHVFGLFEKVSAADGSAASAGDESAALRTGPCIGSVGLIPDPQRRNVDALMLGYSMAKPAWGRGYMTEASREVLRYGFEELALDLVSCTHYPSNDRSSRVIEKCGFAHEGTIHAAEAGPDGVVRDLESYYLTREGWIAGARG